MTQDILELAEEFNVNAAINAEGEWVIKCWYKADFLAFAAAIQAKEAEKWQIRVSELEDTLKEYADLGYFDDNGFELLKGVENSASKALANKSDWLAKHDEQVRTGERKKVLIELAWMASANGNAVLEVQLRNMAEQTEGAQTK